MKMKTSRSALKSNRSCLINFKPFQLKRDVTAARLKAAHRQFIFKKPLKAIFNIQQILYSSTTIHCSKTKEVQCSGRINLNISQSRTPCAKAAAALNISSDSCSYYLQMAVNCTYMMYVITPMLQRSVLRDRGSQFTTSGDTNSGVPNISRTLITY